MNLYQDYIDLHSDAIIVKNQNFIGWILDNPIYYWDQTHGNWWTKPCYNGGIRHFEKYALEIGMMVKQVVSKIWCKYVIDFFADQKNLTEIVEVSTLDVL